jgi:hypothetical protein
VLAYGAMAGTLRSRKYVGLWMKDRHATVPHPESNNLAPERTGYEMGQKDDR